MKAKPIKQDGNIWILCKPQEATHLKLKMLGCFTCRVLPVTIGQSIPGTWRWNGDTEWPTLSPRILAPVGVRGHCLIRDGRMEFLNDCTHEHAGKTVELSDVS